MGLTAKTCVPCRGGVPPLKPAEAKAFLTRTPGWELLDGTTKIERKFDFADFAQAMEFTQKVAELAEAEGHHPDLRVGWGYCEVLFYTHKIKGLHENDFIMAAKVSELA